MLLTATGSIYAQDLVKCIGKYWDATNKKVLNSIMFIENPIDVVTGYQSGTWGTDGKVTWYISPNNNSDASKYDNDFNHQITVHGTVHLILADNSNFLLREGIVVNQGATLHIHAQSDELNSDALGKLKVWIESNSNNNNAGIGGSDDAVAGDIVIHGGYIEAYGYDGAAIGGGEDSNSGNITIYGGKVKARGGIQKNSDGSNDSESGNSAGIGGGYAGSGGTTIIYGGYITAKGGVSAAGIGGGEYYRGGGQMGLIDIHGGIVIAYGGENGAGIGSGDDCRSNNNCHVNIHGGIVKAYGGDNGAGIGSGDHNSSTDNNENNCTGGNVNIYGGNIEAEGGSWAAGIGGGCNCDQGVEILIEDGVISATGGTGGAGIGGGWGVNRNYGHGAGGKVTIKGGKVIANGTVSGPEYDLHGAAGIGGGGGTGAPTHGGEVTISGGTVEAYGSYEAAGIGGGPYGNGGTVTISAGTVKAVGGGKGAGIGGGNGGDGGTTIISGGDVTATGKDGGAGIGGGVKMVDSDNITSYAYGGKGGTTEITGGNVVAYAECSTLTLNNGPAAIGNGIGRTEKGTLTFDDYLKVVTADSESGVMIAATYENREVACQTTNYASISPCDHANKKYTRTYKDHTASCLNCRYYMAESEEHILDSHSQCTECKTLILKYYDDDSDPVSILEYFKGQRVPAVFFPERSLYKDGNWNTLCLPFNLDYQALAISPLAGCTLKTLASSSFDNGTLTLTFTDDVTRIEAGVPYLIKWEEDDQNIVRPGFEDVVISDILNDIATDFVTFKGTYSNVEVDANGDNTKLFLGVNNNLYRPKDETTSAFRSYFQINGLVGDVNEDGVVDIADVTLLVDIILGNITGEYDMADVNGDSAMSVTDVTKLVNIILGEDPGYKIEDIVTNVDISYQ